MSAKEMFSVRQVVPVLLLYTDVYEIEMGIGISNLSINFESK